MNCPYDKKACSSGHSIRTCANCIRFDDNIKLNKENRDAIIAERKHIQKIPKDFRQYPLTPDKCFKKEK